LEDGLGVTNNTGIHRWAGIVTKRQFSGDYAIGVEVRNAKSLGLKSAVGDDSWAGIETLEGADWKKVVITRKQGRISFSVNDQPVRMVDVNSGRLDQAVCFLHLWSNTTAAIRRFAVHSC
jgi:hypothetical protein